MKKKTASKAATDSTHSSPSLVVVGDGWAALGLVSFLSRGTTPVTWISGSGARLQAPLPGLEVGFGEQGGQTWSKLVALMDLSAGELQSGSFVREFRNKAFREPAWTKAPTPDERKAVRDELLWEPERVIAPVFEARFGLTLAEIDQRAREKIATNENVRRIEGVPVQSIQSEDGKVVSLTIASGDVIPCEQIFFADRWSGLSQIAGLPKGLTFTRKRGAVGVLQATLSHDLPMAANLQEGFFGSLHKEAGEEVERHVWGYFSSDGSKSYWTICFSSDEAEDNHAIAKKLRRMKNGLDKMFSGSSWIPEGKTDFLSNVQGEQVRFEESILFSEGEAPSEPVTVSSLKGVQFLTDGYGPASSMTQVALVLEAAGFEALMQIPEAPTQEAEAESSEPAPSL